MIRSSIMPFVPDVLAGVPVSLLDSMRESCGAFKLRIRQSLTAIDWTKPLADKEAIAQLKPCNDDIDRINREEVRRDEEGQRRRMQIRLDRAAQQRTETRND